MDYLDSRKEYVLPTRLESNEAGYRWLSEVAGSCLSVRKCRVDFIFSRCTDIDGNLCAVLGSIIQSLGTRGCEVYFSGVSEKLKTNLIDNDFYLLLLDRKTNEQANEHVVPFRYFSKEESDAFRDYVETNLFKKLNKLKLSEALRKRMLESIAEIYVNAHFHGECELVFCCGQFFQESEQLYFTLVDLGKTIKANVESFFNRPFSGEQAILWATANRNTTKQNHSGGLGLKITKSFIELNRGVMQIVSSNGIWMIQNGTILSDTLPVAFPGTIVNLGFNLTDRSQYILSEEMPFDNPF